MKYEEEIDKLQKEVVSIKTSFEEALKEKVRSDSVFAAFEHWCDTFETIQVEAISKTKEELSQSFSVALATELQKQKSIYEQQISALQRSLKEKTDQIQELQQKKTNKVQPNPFSKEVHIFLRRFSIIQGEEVRRNQQGTKTRKENETRKCWPRLNVVLKVCRIVVESFVPYSSF